jgi:hypothetical protein
MMYHFGMKRLMPLAILVATPAAACELDGLGGHSWNFSPWARAMAQADLPPPTADEQAAAADAVAKTRAMFLQRYKQLNDPATANAAPKTDGDDVR